MAQLIREIALEEHFDFGEAIKILYDRERFYGFLAQCYIIEPSIEFLYELKAQIEVLSKYKLYQEGAFLLSSFFDRSVEKLQDKQQKLEKEFTYLFLAPGSNRVAPYESVHRSKKRLLKQESYDMVVRAFREAGLGKIKDCKELEDHIALEFEYMEIMCAEARFALERDNNDKVGNLLEKQRIFLVKHILRWVPEFCKSVFKESKTQFYKGIALLTNTFISSELEQIDILRKSIVV